MAAYYNENDPYVAQWLRNLIAKGHIAPGEVDERSISDVHPEDVKGFTQCHWFAGVGVWSYAARKAGWPDDRPLWTGSCPCQPFSAAGAGAGFTDERHLWPHWHYLIAERRPPVVLGEQVASPNAEPWIDLVSADVEGLGYAFGATAYAAAGVGAPNLRDRTYWLAYADDEGPQGRGGSWLERPRERSPWSRGVAVRGRDGRQRLIEPGIQPLANGASARVGRVRAYGNALNAEQAENFIRCAMGAMSDMRL